MADSLRDHSLRAIDEESASIHLKNTFTTVNSKEGIGLPMGLQDQEKPSCVYNYMALLSLKGYDQTDFGETFTPVGNLIPIQYGISLVGGCGWNIDQLVVVTEFFNPDVDHSVRSSLLPMILILRMSRTHIHLC